MTHQFRFTEARYIPDLNPRYAGNPYIEHLNPLPDDEELRRRLTILPEFDPSMRQRPAHIRIDLLGNITHVCVPLPRLMRMARTVYRVMRMGYAPRKPRTKSDNAIVGKLLDAQTHGLYAVPYPPRAQANGNLTLSLIGAAGCGKSYGMSRISGLFDEVIFHEQYGKWQVPVLFIEMAYDGESVHVLADELLAALDRLFPDAHYVELYVRRRAGNANQRLAKALDLCYEHGVGLIIVDEAQNGPGIGRIDAFEATHSVVPKRGRKVTSNRESPLIKLLITASNTSHIPMLFSGTLEMKQASGSRFSLLRRLSGNGSDEWHALQRSGSLDAPSEFEMLFRVLCDFQLVQKPVPASPALANLFFDLTQGIPDTMVKLWIAAQEVAIQSGREQISAEVLTAASNRQFKSIHEAIRAMREGNQLVQAAMPDLFDRDTHARTSGRAKPALREPTPEPVTLRSEVSSYLPQPGADASAAAPEDDHQPDVARWDGRRLR